MESITTTPVDVTVSRRAYAKMILHAAKYPHCAVSGLLLAPAKSANGSSKLSLSDAVPLFHQIQGLSPMVEVALAQVDILAQSAQMVVAGYYHANEGYSDQSVDVFSQRVADAVAAHSVSTSALVTIDNRKLGLDGANHALVVQVRGCVEGGKWRKTEEVVVEEGALETASALLQKKVDVVDFDNHLDDLSVDFLNVEVNLEVDRCCN